MRAMKGRVPFPESLLPLVILLWIVVTATVAQGVLKVVGWLMR